MHDLKMILLYIFYTLYILNHITSNLTMISWAHTVQLLIKNMMLFMSIFSNSLRKTLHPNNNFNAFYVCTDRSIFVDRKMEYIIGSFVV